MTVLGREDTELLVRLLSADRVVRCAKLLMPVGRELVSREGIEPSIGPDSFRNELAPPGVSQPISFRSSCRYFVGEIEAERTEQHRAPRRGAVKRDRRG